MRKTGLVIVLVTCCVEVRGWSVKKSTDTNYMYHVQSNLPEVDGAPDETLMLGMVPLPPAPIEPGVPPTFPWAVGDSGTMGRAGEESGVVYLGIPNRLSFLLTLR